MATRQPAAWVKTKCKRLKISPFDQDIFTFIVLAYPLRIVIRITYKINTLIIHSNCKQYSNCSISTTTVVIIFACYKLAAAILAMNWVQKVDDKNVGKIVETTISAAVNWSQQTSLHKRQLVTNWLYILTVFIIFLVGTWWAWFLTQIFLQWKSKCILSPQMQMMPLLIESVGARPGRGNNTSSTNNPVVTTGTATTATNSNKVKQILSDVDTTIK